MSLKDVPVRARLWAPDRSLPRFFGRLLLFFVRFNLTSFAQYLRAAETRGGVAQACRAAPSGDEDVRKCCQESRAAPLGDEDVRKCRSSAPRCTLGRRRCTKVLPKRAVLHPRVTISVVFRCRRVSFIHTSFCPAPLGNGKARKSRLTVPRVTFGCGTVRRHRSRRARRRPLLLSLEGFRGPVAWSCGHYIGHYIRHIRLIFGNFYYCCPEACHTASRPVPVTQGRSGIQTERVTDGRQVIYQSIAELIGLTRL